MLIAYKQCSSAFHNNYAAIFVFSLRKELQLRLTDFSLNGQIHWKLVRKCVLKTHNYVKFYTKQKHYRRRTGVFCILNSSIHNTILTTSYTKQLFNHICHLGLVVGVSLSSCSIRLFTWIVKAVSLRGWGLMAAKQKQKKKKKSACPNISGVHYNSPAVYDCRKCSVNTQSCFLLVTVGVMHICTITYLIGLHRPGAFGDGQWGFDSPFITNPKQTFCWTEGCMVPLSDRIKFTVVAQLQIYCNTMCVVYYWSLSILYYGIY